MDACADGLGINHHFTPNRLISRVSNFIVRNQIINIEILAKKMYKELKK